MIYYGKQESRTNKEEAVAEFKNIETIIECYQKQQYHTLLIGDFNAKIGNDEKGIQNGDKQISRNGIMLRDLIEKYDLTVVNSEPVCCGKWTRISTTNQNEKSILDYVICSSPLKYYIQDMIIDEEENYRLKGKNRSDHNTIILTINKKLNQKNKQNKIWKINEKTDWKKYEEKLKTELCNYKVSADITESNNNLSKLILYTAEQTVGNIYIDSNNSRIKKLIKPLRAIKKEEKRKYEKAIASRNPEEIRKTLNNYKVAQNNCIQLINEHEAKSVESRLTQIYKSGGTNSKPFWNIARKHKQNNLEDLYVIKTKEGKRLFNELEIKQYTKQYYQQLYTIHKSTDCHPEWIHYIEKEIVRLKANRQHKQLSINQPIKMQEIKQEIAKPHNHKSPGPDKIVNEFLKYGGPVLIGKIEELFNKIFKSETIPNQWGEAILVNIDKGKKDKEKLENKRGISLSNSISKVFEKIIVRRVHNEICFTEAQAGGRPNRSTIDHIFTLKSVIQQRFYEKKQTYVAFIDLEKAYDQAWKDAVLYTLWNRGIKGKI